MSRNDDLIKTSVSGYGSYFDEKRQDYYVRQKKVVQRFHPVLRRWQKVEETELEPIKAKDHYNLTDKLEFTIITVRTALDPSSLRNVKAPFRVKVTIETIDKHTYLSMVDNRIIFHNFVQGTSQVASLNESRSQQPLFKVSFGRAKKISNQEALELLKEPDTYKPILEDINGELRHVVFYQKIG